MPESVIPDPMTALISRAVAEKERLTKVTQGAQASADQAASQAPAQAGFNLPPETSSFQDFIQSLSSGVASAVSGNPRFAQNTAAMQAGRESQRAEALKQLNELRAVEAMAHKKELHENRLELLRHQYSLLEQAGNTEAMLKNTQMQLQSRKELDELSDKHADARSRREIEAANTRSTNELAARERMSAADIISNEKIRIPEEYHRALADIEDTASKIRSEGLLNASKFKDAKTRNEILAKAKKAEEEFYKTSASKPILGETGEGYINRLTRAFPGWNTDVAVLNKVESIYTKHFPKDEEAKASFTEKRKELTKTASPTPTKSGILDIVRRSKAEHDERTKERARKNREKVDQFLDRFFK